MAIDLHLSRAGVDLSPLTLTLAQGQLFMPAKKKKCLPVENTSTASAAEIVVMVKPTHEWHSILVKLIFRQERELSSEAIGWAGIKKKGAFLPRSSKNVGFEK